MLLEIKYFQIFYPNSEKTLKKGIYIYAILITSKIK